MMYLLKRELWKEGSEEVYPNIDAEDIKDGRAYFRTNFYDKFIEPKPFFNDLKMYKRLPSDPEPNILNDTHGWGGRSLALSWTIPVSERYKSLLEQYELVGSCFYSGSLIFQGSEYPYFVFHTLKSAWGDVINFETSKFIHYSGECSEKSIFEKLPIKDTEDYELKNKKQFLQNYNKFKNAHDIELKEVHFTKEIDLVFLPVLRYCISERLKNAIEEAGITGVEIKPITNVDFYYNGKKM